MGSAERLSSARMCLAPEASCTMPLALPVPQPLKSQSFPIPTVNLASNNCCNCLQEMIGGLQVNSGSSWAAFDKMEEKVAALEAQVGLRCAFVC